MPQNGKRIHPPPPKKKNHDFYLVGKKWGPGQHLFIHGGKVQAKKA